MIQSLLVGLMSICLLYYTVPEGQGKHSYSSWGLKTCLCNGYSHTLASCKNLAYQACSKILHILPENFVCLLKNLANCKRNGHNLTRTCKNLTSTGLQDLLQALQPCKTLILHARILQESCKISTGILQDNLA